MEGPLPHHIIPSEYILNITPYAFTFDATVTIYADVVYSTNTIILHADQLTIESIEIDGHSIVEIISKNNRWLINTDELSVGPIIIKISYSGLLHDDLLGMYYLKDTWCTQFESIYARRAFPCFDEPALKAVFTLSLNILNQYQAFSNMPIKNRVSIDHNYDRVDFESTPRISSYTFAFVIGRFERVSKDKISIYVSPGQKDRAHLALEVASKSLSRFEEILKVPYTLPKLDIIGLINLQPQGMENYGLITIWECSLLYDEKLSKNKYEVESTIAHEIAHQWFGNLVTTARWASLWLNEGLANYFQFVGIDNWDHMIETRQSGLLNDSLLSSHPLTNPIYRDCDINSMFDDITYDKTASVLNMFVDWMGTDTFYAGCHEYLTKYAYQNTFPDQFMTPTMWTEKAGFPLITVTDNGIVQQRYIRHNDTITDDLWKIPLTILYSTGEVLKIMFQTRHLEIPKKGTWYKVNAGQKAFVRVQYPLKMWDQLVKAPLDPIDRLDLLADLLALTLDGKLLLVTTEPLIKQLLDSDLNLSLIAPLIDIFKEFSGTSSPEPVKNSSPEPVKDFDLILDKYVWETDPIYKEHYLSTLTKTVSEPEIRKLVKVLSKHRLIELNHHHNWKVLKEYMDLDSLANMINEPIRGKFKIEDCGLRESSIEKIQSNIISTKLLRTKWHPVMHPLLNLDRYEFLQIFAKIKSYNLEEYQAFSTFNDWLLWCNEYLTWVPTESYKGNQIDEHIFTLYFFLNQTSYDLSDWLITYAKALGSFLDSSESLTADSIASFYNSPKYRMNEYIPEWTTFNELFARHVKPGYRPIAEPNNDSVIVSVADSTYKGAWLIDDQATITAKGIKWSISELIGDKYGIFFKNGVFMHAFLNPHDYHRLHVPIGGNVIHKEIIPGNVYLETHIKNNRIQTTRTQTEHIGSKDEVGYQFTQARGLLILETIFGLIAILPIGMSLVSSVVFTVEVGEKIQKGQEFGYFKFGASDYIILFSFPVTLTAKIGKHYDQGQAIGYINDSKIY